MGRFHVVRITLFYVEMVSPELISLDPIRVESGDELFMSKYSEAGGNPRDFVWKGLLATMTL